MQLHTEMNPLPLLSALSAFSHQNIGGAHKITVCGPEVIFLMLLKSVVRSGT